MTQALAKNDNSLIDNINKQLTEAKTKGAHVLTPLTLQSVPPMHRPVVVAVQIDPDPKNKEVYPQKGGGLSLSALSFKRLLDAMDVRWVVPQCGRTDDGSDPNLVRYRMVGKVKGLDGTWHDLFGEKEIRLETVVEELTDNYREKAIKYANDPKDGPEFRRAFPDQNAVDGWIREKVRQDALQIKKHMLARAQTGAMARACKSKGIRETYTAEELKHPFVFPKLVPELDPNNPEDRAFLRNQAMGASDALYPATSATTMPAKVTESTEDLRIIDVPDVAEVFTPTPTKEEQIRADFQAADPREQTIALKDLIKRKGYKGKVDGDMEKWSAPNRSAFLNRLLEMPDAQPDANKPAPLPFE
jgi:hypothetical protein